MALYDARSAAVPLAVKARRDLFGDLSDAWVDRLSKEADRQVAICALPGFALPAIFMLSARTEAGELQVEIADDGRGIDWSGVRDRAAARGLPCSTQDDLVRALFHPGFTTRDTATAVSGRGIGLGAVEHELRRLGGAVSVTSARGRGTTWRFTFPLPASASRVTSTTERSVAASAAAE